MLFPLIHKRLWHEQLLDDLSKQWELQPNTHELSSLDAFEDGFHPWRVTRLLEKAQRFSESQVSHDVKCGTVVEHHQVELGTRLRIYLLVDVHDELVDVFLDERLLKFQSLVAECIREDFANTAVVASIGDADDGVFTVDCFDVQARVLWVFRPFGCAVSVNVFPCLRTDVTESVWADADNLSVLFVNLLGPGDDSALAGDDVVCKGSCRCDFGARI